MVAKPKEDFVYFPPLIEEVQKLGVMEYETCTDIMVHYTYFLTKKEPDKLKLKEIKDLIGFFKESGGYIMKCDIRNDSR